MILKNKTVESYTFKIAIPNSFGTSWKLLIASFLIVACFSYSTCKYGFKNLGAIPPEVTFRVNPLSNRAQYINVQLAPQLTEKLKQKIINTTRLRQTNNDDAHYDISGMVTQYYTSTTGISGNNASTNRLNVSFHLVFKNSLDEKKNFEQSFSRFSDYKSTQSLTSVENDLIRYQLH